MAEALRKRIESTKIAHADAKKRTLSNIELQKRADAALYETRFRGGNKVVAYQPLSKLKLVHWDQPNDGPLSEQSLTQKLLV
jgi:hypothetical protein